MEISLTSFGSSQTFPLPHLSTLAERRFCSLSETIFAANVGAAKLITDGEGEAPYKPRVLDEVHK